MPYVEVKCIVCGETYEWVPDNNYSGPADGVRGTCLPCDFDAALAGVVDADTAEGIKIAMNTAGLMLATHYDYGVSVIR